MRLIGITGKIGAGKDSLFNAIEKLIPAKKYAFATALKMQVALACNVTVDEIEANKPLYRPMLQWFGTEFRRGLQGDDYWIKQLNVAMAEHTDKLRVVTDVRFPNEADFIKDNGGIVVAVYRPGSSESSHTSEHAMSGYRVHDYIWNDGTLEDLERQAELLIKRLPRSIRGDTEL